MGEVVISCGAEVIAQHRRSYERDDFVFDPIHYLPLLERKTGALDQAAPLAGWELPEEFGVLRRLLESRMGRRGKREFVQVLRLMESFRKEEVYEGVRDALRLGAISFDAVKHLVPCRVEGRPQRLDLQLYPYLPRVSVTRTAARELHDAHAGERAVSERSTVLLEHHLKELKLPTFLREYGKVASQCAAEDVDHPGYLQRLSELELIDRHHRMVDRRIKAARFPATKSLDTFDFLAIPSVNKHLVMQLARCEYVDRRENVIAVGNSGTGKTHVALGLGLAVALFMVVITGAELFTGNNLMLNGLFSRYISLRALGRNWALVYVGKPGRGPHRRIDGLLRPVVDAGGLFLRRVGGSHR